MDSVNVALMKVSEALATLMMIRDVLLEQKNPIEIGSYLPVTGKIVLFDAINRQTKNYIDPGKGKYAILVSYSRTSASDFSVNPIISKIFKRRSIR